MRTYIAEYPIRGYQVVLVHNARSAKEARKKVLSDSLDVESLDHRVDKVFRRSVKVRVDRSR